MSVWIDIIVPVYKGYKETVICINSVLHYRDSCRHKLIIINDNSPDEEIVKFLNSIIDENVLLINNDKNLGFVKSANKGMRLSKENDILLLNSDTEVFGNWLEKIKNSAYVDKKIGTVTPLSNSATICSYPRFCKDNELPVGMSLAKMNQIFEAISDNIPVQTPTGVGFCMYIKRAVLDDIGFFDEVSFGKGYGEENDFCMRAKKAGWNNVITTDTYIYHSGSASFGTSKFDLISNGKKAIESKYPSYESEIQAFIVKDELRIIRRKADLKRFSTNLSPAILFITHNMGGGTERCVNEMANEWIKKGLKAFILKPQGDYILFSSGDNNDEFIFKFQLLKNYDDLVALCKNFNVKSIHYHHLLGHQPIIKKLPEDIGCSYYVFIHDYYLICPRISLIRTNGEFCEEKNIVSCGECLNDRPYTFTKNIEQWRMENFLFLNDAQGIAAPSHDTIMRIKKYYPTLEIKCCPHAELDHQVEQNIKNTLGERLRIGIIGAISKIKGADFVYLCIKDKTIRKLPLEYVVIGYTYKQISTLAEYEMEVTGQYKEDEVLRLIEAQKIDVLFFPARAPETYSYTLSWGILAGVPAVATNVGAVSERIKMNNIGWVVEKDISSGEMNDFFVNILHNPTTYFEKLNNFKKVELKRKFKLEDYYKIDELRKSSQEVKLNNLDELVKKYDFRNAFSLKRKIFSFLIKRRHYPIARDAVWLVGDKGKQLIKKFLGF